MTTPNTGRSNAVRGDRAVPARRVKASRDPQVAQMIADPAAYFARARTAARVEAHTYVARRTAASGVTRAVRPA